MPKDIRRILEQIEDETCMDGAVVGTLYGASEIIFEAMVLVRIIRIRATQRYSYKVRVY